MTSFAVQSTLGAAAPLVSKDKGSIGNRMDCAGSHIKNNVTTGVQAVAVGGAAVGLTVAGNKGNLPKTVEKVATFVTKMTNILATKFGMKTVIGPNTSQFTSSGKHVVLKPGTYYEGIFNKIMNLTKEQKAFAALAAVALPVLAYINHKHSYKAGQIDQKYTDKAQMQDVMKKGV